MIDKHPRPGDQWRNRYKSLCLHDPVWYDHLPYLKFPDNWPVFAPKDKIGDWLESYTKIMEVPYWSSTAASSASRSEETGEWTVEVEREGKPLTLRPKQLVFATGMSGKPNVPAVPGMDVFGGDLHHSSAHPGPDAYRGKKVVVIGSNNSAFDICGALWGERRRRDDGAAQLHAHREERQPDGDRARRPLLRAGRRGRRDDREGGPDLRVVAVQDPAHLPDPGLRGDGGEGQGVLRAAGGGRLRPRLGRRRVGPVHEVPPPRLGLLHRRRCRRPGGQRRRQAGQGPDRPPDGGGRRAGGRHRAPGRRGRLRHRLRIDERLGRRPDRPETADRLGKVWGLGSDTTKDPGPWEGEQRNMWKPTQIENLWMHGGNLHQSRHYSLYLALQFKARFEGIDTPVYALQEVHHTG
ncbi:NAD(P)-binding domain-containing protein [Nocardioides sp. B-3]|uniref:NAD(P)-binding domain-containing protein n=1 Tax=Nocardioides sp. B-3 TaxID=2895565 RepID=UPI0021536E1C|nr:NAD(P)/FAD-dependent oxidoreductase [Nocardioides sp. B-3]UUZ58903.1 NAD(P)/FAD-dependent oxidoreductase [Nocardioides sp. B-3]